MDQEKNEVWAVIELMGHAVTGGVIKPSDIGGLLRIDVPIEDGFKTEYYGEKAIYSIKIVSEEIARVYARPERGVIAYDEPIVPRHVYEDALQKARNINDQLQHQIRTLSNRLTRVRSLPAPGEEEEGL